MKTRSLLFALITISFFSCYAPKSFTHAVPTFEMSDILPLEALTYIQLIERGSRMVYSDSLSERSCYMIHDALKNTAQIPLSDTIYFWDRNDLKTVEHEIQFLIKHARIANKNQQVAITPTIYEAIKSSGKRFGLITYSEGFKRSNNNYVGQIVLGVLIGVATMGTVMYMPYKSSSTMSFIIVDVEKDEVSFFGSSVRQDVDPLNPKLIDLQIKDVFRKEFKAPKAQSTNYYDF